MAGDKTSRPTTADVARLAQVSTATVSYVLNKTEGKRISARTSEAVQRAAAQLGYRPNFAAQNLARGKSGVVLYVVPRVAVGEMPMQAGSRMTTELARLGLLQVQIFETEDDQHVVDAIHNLNPIAVTSLFPLSGGASSAVRAANVPHIEIGALPALGDYWLDGIARAAQSHGLEPVSVDDVTVDNAAAVAAGWVRDGVTAVCAQSDEIACLVLYGIREAGLRCPQDLAVIGVDANPMGAISSPPLTTVEFNPTAVADAAIAAVLTELGFPAPAPPEPSDIAHLVVRAST